MCWKNMSDNPLNPNQKVRVAVGIIIMIAIAAIHFFRVGSYLNGNLYNLYYSFASDIMLPFGAYFLLCLNEIQLRFLRKWYLKALLVFGVMTFSEGMQLFGITFLELHSIFWIS